MFSRVRFLAPRTALTEDDLALLRELPSLPHWQAVLKVHGNSMADVTDEIIVGKDTSRSLHVLDDFRSLLESFAKERPDAEPSSLM